MFFGVGVGIKIKNIRASVDIFLILQKMVYLNSADESENDFAI